MSNRGLESSWYSYVSKSDINEFLQIVRLGDKIEIKRSTYSHFALIESITTDGDAAAGACTSNISLISSSSSSSSSFVSAAKSFLSKIKGLTPPFIGFVIDIFIGAEDSVAISQAIAVLKIHPDPSFRSDVDAYVTTGINSESQLHARMTETLDLFVHTDFKSDPTNTYYFPDWLEPLRSNSLFKEAAESFFAQLKMPEIHHTVLRSNEYDVMVPYVIHLTSRPSSGLLPTSSGCDNTLAVVRRDRLETAVEESKFRINNGSDRRYAVRLESEILDAAREAVKESERNGGHRYDVLKLNCEHMVNEWRHGKSFSDQADKFSGMVDTKAKEEFKQIVLC